VALDDDRVVAVEAEGVAVRRRADDGAAGDVVPESTRCCLVYRRVDRDSFVAVPCRHVSVFPRLSSAAHRLHHGPPMPSRETLIASFVVIAAASTGCSSAAETTGPATGDDPCAMIPVDPGPCTSDRWQDCTWTEVMHNGSYCPACTSLSGNRVGAADCGGYHVLARYGIDQLQWDFYDLTTGKLVARMHSGGTCQAGPLPADCKLFHTLPSWCDGFQADGTGTKCCYDIIERTMPDPACPSSQIQVGMCGDYNVETASGTSFDGDKITETSYFDTASGKLIATIDTIKGQTWCTAGPATGIAAPSCTPAYLPMCAAASGP
jgi:hypothetical protein